MFPLPVGDIVQTLQSDRERRFTNFLRAVFSSGLAETLQGTHPFISRTIGELHKPRVSHNSFNITRTQFTHNLLNDNYTLIIIWFTPHWIQMWSFPLRHKDFHVVRAYGQSVRRLIQRGSNEDRNRQDIGQGTDPQAPDAGYFVHERHEVLSNQGQPFAGQANYA